jgi:hypothetical protein
MSVHFNIVKALVDSVLNLGLPQLAGVPVEAPNTDISPYPSLWLKASVIPNECYPVTLGVDGDDNHNGLLQIDINVPINTGDGLINNIAGEIKKLYPAGRNISPVVVASSSISPARIVGSNYRISVTVTYYSRIARSA